MLGVQVQKGMRMVEAFSIIFQPLFPGHTVLPGLPRFAPAISLMWIWFAYEVTGMLARVWWKITPYLEEKSYTGWAVVLLTSRLYLAWHHNSTTSKADIAQILFNLLGFLFLFKRNNNFNNILIYSKNNMAADTNYAVERFLKINEIKRTSP